MPLISPTLFFLTIVNTIAALQVFDQAYLLFYRDGTSSAPDAALFYGVYLFQQAFRQFNFGLAAAMAWLLFVIILGITAIQIKVGNRLVYYEGGAAMTLAAAPSEADARPPDATEPKPTSSVAGAARSGDAGRAGRPLGRC